MNDLLDEIKSNISKARLGLIDSNKFDSILLDTYKRLSLMILTTKDPILFIETLTELNSLSGLLSSDESDKHLAIPLLLTEYCGFLLKNQKDVFSEKMLESSIIESFSEFEDLNHYVFVKKQVNTPNGRIDILAKCKKTHADVLIEVKKRRASGHRQLFDYARYYDNPILINLSEIECKNKVDGIIYLSLDKMKKF
jgi:hypothetical protein